MYNVPFIHRAYCLTNQASLNKELFIPIMNPQFIKKYGSRESWIQFELEDKYNKKHTFNKLPHKFKKYLGVTDKCIIRYNDKFEWGTHDTPSENLRRLKLYHKKVRRYFYHIYNNGELWYIKRNSIDDSLNMSTLSLTFAIMHRLSEIARYQPRLLESHLFSQSSWLETEFIEKSLTQFVDEISSEICGENFKLTGFRS